MKYSRYRKPNDSLGHTSRQLKFDVCLYLSYQKCILKAECGYSLVITITLIHSNGTKSFKYELQCVKYNEITNAKHTSQHFGCTWSEKKLKHKGSKS